MRNEVMFSSKNQAWATRWEYFNKWNERFNFTLDVCAGNGDQKCEKYYTPDDDGLIQDWTLNDNVFWCNPEYGRGQINWITHGFRQKASGVFLIPSRTDTKLFHDVIMKGVEEGYCTIEFIKGRLVFGSDEYWRWVWEQHEIDGKPNSLYGKVGKMNPAPFPSMLVKCGECAFL